MPITRSQLLALPSPKPPARTTGIEGWVQLVASSTRESRRQLVPISSNIRARGPEPLKLKSQQPNSRQPKSHQPTTSGKRGTKRKSAMDNDQDYTPVDEGEAIMNPQKRGRGRPPKNPAQAAPILRPIPHIDLQSTTSGSNSQKPSRKSSPRKGAKYIDQPRSTTNVDMKTLETCSPSVTQMTDTEAKQQCQVPTEVIRLLKNITSIPPGVIPRALQESTALLLHLRCLADS
jgi:hypothetical protein